MEKIKKLVSLLLVLAMCTSLAACGSKDNTTPSGPSSVDADITDANDTTDADGPTDAQLEALTDAYNQVAELYNEVVEMAETNGWMADPELVASLELIGTTMDPVGQALSGDISALEGTDYDAAPDVIMEFLPMLQALREQVAAPYAGGAGDDVDAQLKALTDAYNQVAELYNEVAITAEANGWADVPEAVAVFDEITAALEPVGQILSGDTSVLDGVDLDQLTSMILEYVPALQQLKEEVSVPYGDEG